MAKVFKTLNIFNKNKKFSAFNDNLINQDEYHESSFSSHAQADDTDYRKDVHRSSPNTSSPLSPETKHNIDLDIIETDTGYEIYADVPGVRLTDLQVNVYQDLLTVSYSKQQPAHGRSLLRSERPVGRFGRTIKLPLDCDASQHRAEMCEGVLVVHIGKQKSARSY
eukprot:GILJ01011243.1.p1 GENE.GILJ01011243.1~~GILJ01011243.1.p1  ORF type:complete len:166 (+),score=17.49 GILJ01011243.1:96-593(+)